MNFKKYLIIFVSVYLSGELNAQSFLDSDLINDPDTSTAPMVYSNPLPDITIHKKPDFDLSAGTSFNYMGRYGSFSTIYAAPSWKMSLSKRLTIRAGAIINYTPFTSVPAGLYYQEDHKSSSSQPVGVMIFTEGTYLLNPRLTITGTAYKEITPAYRPFINPYYNNNYKVQGASIGFSYKLLKNVQIGAQFHYNNMPNTLLNSDFNNPYFGPVYW